MQLTEVVSDASVALKWFHDQGEEEVESSRALLDRHRERRIALSVLDLTSYEIGNALLRGRAGVTAQQVGIVLQALADLCPRLSLTAVELAQAAILAQRHELTLYDAAYAAAAASRGAHLATLDRAILRSGLGHRPSDIVRGLSTEK